MILVCVYVDCYTFYYFFYENHRSFLMTFIIVVFLLPGGFKVEIL